MAGFDGLLDAQPQRGHPVHMLDYWWLIILVPVGLAALWEGWKIGGIPSDLADKLRRENREARRRKD